MSEGSEIYNVNDIGPLSQESALTLDEPMPSSQELSTDNASRSENNYDELIYNALDYGIGSDDSSTEEPPESNFRRYRAEFGGGDGQQLRTVTLHPNELADELAGDSAHEPNIFIWGTRVCITSVKMAFRRFILDFDPTKNVVDNPSLLRTLIRQPSIEHSHYLDMIDDIKITENPDLDLNLLHVRKFNPELYRQIVCYPSEIIPYLDFVANEFFRERFGTLLRTPIEVRPYNSERTRSMRDLNPGDIDQLITITGMVTRVSHLIPEMRAAFFKCCICDFTVETELDRGRIDEPNACSHCSQSCSFQLIHNRCYFIDKQLIKLQESPDDMPAGQTPQTVTLFAYGTLVESVQPGDRVSLTGIYRATPVRTNPRTRYTSAIYRTNIDVLHFSKIDSKKLRLNDGISLSDERIDRIKELARKENIVELLCDAVAPQIFGHMDVKLGVLCLLFGGTQKPDHSDGSKRVRTEINILLCGDPGTSKSQILQYVYRLVPRAQYTSGKGSSAVGLTASVCRDPETKNMVLRTGALVLADNGVCCIDEFDKMSDSTRSVLHEVMEQQTLSIAKAGIICQLNARASILAAANPVDSQWNRTKTIVDNIKLPHTLLSRFDLIFLLVDEQCETYDRQLANHLVSLFFEEVENIELPIDSRLLHDYISYARKSVHPELTETAVTILINRYLEMRQAGSHFGQVSAYPRQLESLIRLSEAYAKLHLRHVVDADDVECAYNLYREALRQSAVDPATGCVDVSILASGITTRSRKLIEQLSEAIRTELVPHYGDSVSIATLMQQLRQKNNSFPKEIFEEAVNELVRKEVVVRMGDKLRYLRGK